MVGFEQYGGKRGYLEYVRSRLLYSLGAYRQAERIEWSTINRLVFVCKGNICRSPYAAEKSRMLGTPAISCGLEASQGAAADAAAVRNAERRNVDLSPHRSSIYDSRRLRETDLVVVFEPRQLIDVRRLMRNRPVSITLLGIWSKTTSPYIHDPYGQSDEFFQRTYAAIDAYVMEVVRRITAATTGRDVHPRQREFSEDNR